MLNLSILFIYRKIANPKSITPERIREVLFIPMVSVNQRIISAIKIAIIIASLLIISSFSLTE